jgi:hypothetical protein
LVKPSALIAAALIALASCREPGRVDARDHDAFWLWAGVSPQPVLARARTIYLLDGEVRDDSAARYVPLRAGVPRLPDKRVWLVVRTDTLRWPRPAYATIDHRLAQWEAANGLEGVQIDFDARTRHLEDYAAFLADLRKRLPRRYRLSVTGLLDWSANGDPSALERLKGQVDEVVIQTYQGRETIPGYEAYFDRLEKFDIPFRVGLIQGGRWIEPPALRRNPRFRGYVVFLLQPRGRRG